MQSPIESPRGQLLSNYVLARIVDMTPIDIGLFDYDRHNAVYIFLLNDDEHIYMRYGGREPESGETYLNLDSLEIALRLGLQQHARYAEGQLPPQPRPRPLFSADIPLLKEHEIDRGRCVECHLIADYQAQQGELDGSLDKLSAIYRSPDIKNLGIHLEIPKGVLVKEAVGAAVEAGVQAGDTLASIDGIPVLTFGDFLYHYDKTPRMAKTIDIGVKRGEQDLALRVNLPEEWWRTDLYYRFWTVEPQLYFFAKPLTPDEKAANGLKPEGFASRITEADPGAIPLRVHDLKEGDIIFAVNGVETDSFTHNAEVYMILNLTSGKEATVSIVRDGERMDRLITPYRQYYRKQKS